MAISMAYECTGCDFDSYQLQDAQAHANRTGHVVAISGSLTANVVQFDQVAIAKAAEQKARDEAILREGRRRGILPQKGGGR